MATSQSESLSALLGKGSEFEGKLTFEGTVRIDGKFSGDIFSKGKLVIGEGALVKAEIDVDTLILSGELSGNVTAVSKVELHAPGKLKGNIKCPVLSVNEGVIFEGSCQMENVKGDKNLSVIKGEGTARVGVKT
jgi:cytoskeletal protein CcmA (bactofilin family)